MLSPALLFFSSGSYTETVGKEGLGMMVISFRLRWGRMILAAGCLLLLVVGAVAWWRAPPAAAQVFNLFGNKAEVRLGSNDDRVDYLAQLGWEVDPEPVGEMEVIIPQKFDQVYEGYCRLQEEQGFKLERHKGRTVTKVTYQVHNYPDQEEVLANLILYKDKIIAADLCSARLGGFIKPLKPAS